MDSVESVRSEFSHSEAIFYSGGSNVSEEYNSRCSTRKQLKNLIDLHSEQDNINQNLVRYSPTEEEETRGGGRSKRACEVGRKKQQREVVAMSCV
uniref:Uncharacterized protein n=1 Tax=Oryza barthii TaxID=65489 RepID=A0A0D3FR39_9ORYZ